MKNKIVNFYRTFPDLLPKGGLYDKIIGFIQVGRRAFSMHFGKVFFVYFGVLVVLLSFVLLFSYQVYLNVASQHFEHARKLEYWEEVVTSHPNYPDGYYNAAYFAARLGRKHLALKYVESSLYLDANFSEAKELKSEILRMR
ncbi:MAG: hypothetical protein COU27_01130 [Candidatus Levybacteria bacterium CG10_big_fil_rev_8_21_14_0_10_36_7]|nr:MAG: hypothetical protein COU27_01130 [Candidatus Levybacteria bacterium CG10_big_fil_rev_8_21_14_0_10_36_7]